MATRVSEDTEVASHYATQVALTAALLAALRRLWPTVNPITGNAAEGRYREGVAALVDRFSAASISLSADYYSEMRDRADAPGAFRVPIIDTPPRSLVDAGIDWALTARAEMDRTAEEIQARVDAAMQKAVADVGREQVVAAVEGDELALGFARVARPDACYWCIALAIRKTRPKPGVGERPGVYKSRATAGQLPPNEKGEINRYHYNCHCVVVPVFDDKYQLEPHLADMDALYAEATENSKKGQALNDFRKALYAARNGNAPKFTTAPTGPAASNVDRLAALQKILAGFGN